MWRRVAELVFPVVSRSLFLAKLREAKVERYSITSQKTWIQTKPLLLSKGILSSSND
jgi:hypothetical protein